MLPNITEYDVVNQVPMTVFEGLNHTRLHCVNTLPEWRAFFELLMQQKLVACDTETSGFHYFKQDRICGLSFGWGKDHFYIPVRHLESCLNGPQPPQLSMDDIREDLIKFFSQEDVFTIWHNAKFDSLFLSADGIEVLTPIHDTRILWHFFDENAPGKLKTIASGWVDILGRRMKGLVGKDANDLEKAIDKWRDQEARARRKMYNKLVMDKADELQKDPAYQSYGRRELKKLIAEQILVDHPYRNASKDDVHYGYVPIELMTKYASVDTYLTWMLYEHVMKNMTFSPKLRDLYINEIKLSKILKETEQTGVLVDAEYLRKLGEEYDEKISILRDKLFAELKLSPDTNLDSNQQVANALLDYGIPLTKKTDAGKSCADCAAGICRKHFAVDNKALKKFDHDYPVVNTLLEYRNVVKLRGTYVQGILDKITDDGILHCSFNQNVKTGRMSCSDPNLQNIPGRDQSIRRAFINKGDEWVYVFFDYSQIEVRLTGHYSQDPLLIDSYAKNQDVHLRTCCEVFNYDYDESKKILDDASHALHKEIKSFRGVSKITNFGIIYGVGAPGLSEQIPRPAQHAHLTHKEWVQVCQTYIDQYLDKYLGVARFVNQGKRTVRKYSQVENSFGRIRHLPHAKATTILRDRGKYWLEAKAGRQGVNFLVQGDAADLFKTAVVRVGKLLRGKKTHIVNFVHDEVQLYVHKSELHLLKEIKALMEDFPQFTVPIIVDIEYSTTNWAAKEAL